MWKNCVDFSCHVNEKILSPAVSSFQVVKKAVEMTSMMKEKWQTNDWQMKTGLGIKWMHNLTPG